MHELSICSGILDVAHGALARLAPPLPPVRSVRVRVGRLTGVVPETLRHYYALLSPGTPLAGSRLEIEEIPIRGWCSECWSHFEIDELSFTCPICGSGLVELLSGRELEVVSLDTAEVEETPIAEASHGH